MSWRFLFLTAIVALSGISIVSASTIYSFTGDLRSNANFVACCTLGTDNSDDNYAQWAAVVSDFSVVATSTMEAISFSYGGGINGHGATI
jgi:hypothetical protein